MYFLAPLVLALVVSGALYKTKEIWPKAAYDMLTEKGPSAVTKILQLQKDLNKAVSEGKITQQEAQHRFIAAEKQVAMDML